MACNYLCECCKLYVLLFDNVEDASKAFNNIAGRICLQDTSLEVTTGLSMTNSPAYDDKDDDEDGNDDTDEADDDTGVIDETMCEDVALTCNYCIWVM